MIGKPLSFVVLTLLLIAVVMRVGKEGGKMPTLTGSTFDDEISKHEISLVKFYVPWCGYCQRLAPDFEVAAAKLKSSDPPVALLDVDCVAEQILCEKYEIRAYPTLKIFRKGQLSGDYEGPRDAEGIVNYMVRQAGPAVLELNSLEDLEKFIDADEHVVVGFFKADSQLKEAFFELADSERDAFRFAHTDNEDIFSKVGFSDDIVIYVPKKLHNAFEPDSFKYEGDGVAEKIKEFILEKSTGLVGVRTFAKEFLFKKLPLVSAFYHLDYDNFTEEAKEWRNKVLEVANDYKGKVYFAVGNLVDYAYYLEYFGLKDFDDTEKPFVTMLTDKGRFGLKNEFSIENLKQFVDDVIADKIEPYVVSEPIPETQGDLKVAVAKNFHELITNADKDVLIEFYAPWCGHCKALAPKYEELAIKLKNKNVVVAKMDVTVNDLPEGYIVRGVPTIYWLPKDTKVLTKYEGPHEVSDIFDFVAKHSTDGFKDSDAGVEEEREEL